MLRTFYETCSKKEEIFPRGKWLKPNHGAGRIKKIPRIFPGKKRG